MMNKIDISRWKEFKLGELFDIIKGRRLTKANMLEGDINFIGSSAMNNGITAHIGNIEHVHDGSVLTVCYNGSVGETFYQDEPFWASDDVNILKPKHIVSKEALLFASAIIRHLGQAYDWVDKWTRAVMLNTSIKLPATPSGNPDWEYMGKYMAKVMKESEVCLENLRSADEKKTAVDVAKWKEFRVGDLFEAKRGKSMHLQQIPEGSTPVIAAGGYNQGIAGFYDIEADYENAITISCNGVGCGSTFYHNYPFTVNGDAIALTEKYKMSGYAKIFIANVYNSYFSNIYSYAEKCSANKALGSMIPLPATPSGDPDWPYMEAYMSRVMQESASCLDSLAPRGGFASLFHYDASTDEITYVNEWSSARVPEDVGTKYNE